MGSLVMEKFPKLLRRAETKGKYGSLLLISPAKRDRFLLRILRFSGDAPCKCKILLADFEEERKRLLSVAGISAELSIQAAAEYE